MLSLIIPSKEGLWREGSSTQACLPDIALYSSRLADARRYLLLGPNDDERMRLVIIPRDETVVQIMTLSLTFAGAKTRLEKEWEKQQAAREEDMEQNAPVDEATS